MPCGDVDSAAAMGKLVDGEKFTKNFCVASGIVVGTKIFPVYSIAKCGETGSILRHCNKITV